MSIRDAILVHQSHSELRLNMETLFVYDWNVNKGGLSSARFRADNVCVLREPLMASQPFLA